jgi:3-oxoacyl-[acyl-carrier protein] reductase
MRLKARVVLITGGAAGIGQATALRFAEEGAKVVICDVSEEAGQRTVDELGPDAAFYRVDVADRRAVQEWVDDVFARYGRIDVLVNNAGVLRDNMRVKVKHGELVKQMPEEEFDLVVAVNLKGVFNCTQAVAPYMIRQGSGVILNATSVVGLDGNFGQTNYVATKAGVIGMTKVWARELGRYNRTAWRRGRCLPLPGIGRGIIHLWCCLAGRWWRRRWDVRVTCASFCLRQPSAHANQMLLST